MTTHQLSKEFKDILAPALSLSQTTSCNFTKLCIDKVISDFFISISTAEDIKAGRNLLNEVDKALIVDAMHYGDHWETNDFPEEVAQIADDLKSSYRKKYGNLAPEQAILGPENANVPTATRIARNMGKCYLSSIINDVQKAREESKPICHSVKTQITYALSFGISPDYDSFCNQTKAELVAINNRFKEQLGNFAFPPAEFAQQPRL